MNIGGNVTQAECVLEISHTIHYSNRAPIPISEIASSLVALERIVLRSRRVLTAVTGIEIERIDVFVQDIRTGSLTDDILVTVLFGDQEKKEAFFKKINGKLENHRVVKNALVGAVLFGIAGYGVFSAVKAMSSSDAARSININNSVVFSIAGKETGMSPEQIEGIIKASITDKKANAQDAIEFVRPAKSDPQATISLLGQTGIEISKDTVAKAPSTLKIEANPSDQFIPDVDLQIRATNLDSNESGWACLAPPLISRRVKLVLGEGILPKDVAGKFIVRADIIVHSKPQGDKKTMKPYQITLVNLITD